jgi:hypothetical protein
MNLKLVKKLRVLARSSTKGMPDNLPSKRGMVRVVIGSKTTRGSYLQLKKLVRRGTLPAPTVTLSSLHN